MEDKIFGGYSGEIVFQCANCGYSTQQDDELEDGSELECRKCGRKIKMFFADVG